jgi:hypothetical protein
MAKKKSVRGLNPNCHYSYNKEFVDIDYADKLSGAEAEWLGNFMDNYYGARFKKDPEKNPIKDRNECERQAHARRRDYMSARFKSRTVYSVFMQENLEATDIGVYKSRNSTERDDSDE